MPDILFELEQSLIKLEELLLFELDKARNQITDQLYVSLKENRRTRLLKHYKKIEHLLLNSGDISRLELMTDIHEQLRFRLNALKILLQPKQIASAYLEVAHQDLLHSRIRLEKRVVARRNKLAANSPASPRHQDVDRAIRPVSAREKSLNQLNVTRTEAAELEDVRTSNDTSIYSAARELKVLAAYVRIHKGKTPPAPKGRAYFVSKELSHNIHDDVKTHLQEININKSRLRSAIRKNAGKKKKKLSRDIAQTPEDIRKKLEARGDTATASGPSVFESRDIYSEADEIGGEIFIEKQPREEKPVEKPPLPTRDPGEQIAQTPEEIRRKLEERRKKEGNTDEQPKGKAVFESRDLTPQR